VVLAKLHLSLSCGDYDRTRYLIDGTVQPEGIDLTVIPLVSAERHDRFTRNLEFDVCELQMGVFLGWKARGAPFTAIPVFPHRKFCHGNVVVNARAGIERPADLAGRTIGMQAHFNPVSVWMRGLLQEEYGVAVRSLKVRTNAGEQVPGWSPPSWMDHRQVKRGRVEALVAEGEIDAYMLPDVGPALAGTTGVRRLWPNYRDEEIAYFRRTGIFPIRHTVVVKNDVLKRDPWVAVSLVKAFTRAKELGIAHMSDQRRSFLAWYGAELEAEREILGPDPWPYTVEDNRVGLETMARYATICGVTDRTLEISEMFAETTLVKARLQE
jgi:4,5-dihydroxyphthalate decarboxylase